MVARSAGGREVAGSNPVTPTFYKDRILLCLQNFLPLSATASSSSHLLYKVAAFLLPASAIMIYIHSKACSILIFKHKSISDCIDDLEEDAKKALKQIDEKRYAEELRTEGYRSMMENYFYDAKKGVLFPI